MTVAFSDYIAFFTLLFFCAGCTTEPHKAAGTESNAMIAEPPENTGIKVTRTIQLSGIPSGSGMVAANGILYIIGDDSPFLYRLDKEYNQLPPVTIFKTSLFGSGRIAKKDKPDLEALSSIEINNQTFLLAIGSGSSENRQKAYLINLASEKPEVEEISLLAGPKLVIDFQTKGINYLHHILPPMTTRFKSFLLRANSSQTRHLRSPASREQLSSK
ncbi:MAG: hypothetical protein EOP50_08575 [Sphingobacteriales bacterium]|nr:MAG: hypothetical protein EOP50_08575 [Sphingobacteriales bacterium]